MEVKITYSKIQLEKTIKFIAKNNPSFYKKNDEIRSTILEYMSKMALDLECSWIGTMGFTLIADRTLEDLDNDEYTCHIDILIDPSLGEDNVFLDDDWQETVVNGEFKDYYKTTI